MVQEKLEQFYNEHLDLEYREHWTDNAIGYIADAYAIGINDKWVVAQLECCRHQEIHKTIINKCREKLEFWQTDENDKKAISRIMKEHKARLYSILSEDIYNYCVR